MFLMVFILQMPTDPPSSFLALQWVALLAMAGALAYVFRLWQKEKENCTKQYLDTIDKLMEALHDKEEDEFYLDINDVKEP